LSICDPDF